MKAQEIFERVTAEMVNGKSYEEAWQAANSGTSEGAKKGWESRLHGAFAAGSIANQTNKAGDHKHAGNEFAKAIFEMEDAGADKMHPDRYEQARQGFRKHYDEGRNLARSEKPSYHEITTTKSEGLYGRAIETIKDSGGRIWDMTHGSGPYTEKELKPLTEDEWLDHHSNNWSLSGYPMHGYVWDKEGNRQIKTFRMARKGQ